FAELLHAVIFGQDVADDAVQFLVAADLHQQFEQLGSNPEALPLVADEQRKLGIVGGVNFAQPAHPQDFVLVGLGVPVIHDQRDFAIVIVETNAGQSLMGDPLGKF